MLVKDQLFGSWALYLSSETISELWSSVGEEFALHADICNLVSWQLTIIASKPRHSRPKHERNYWFSKNLFLFKSSEKVNLNVKILP